MIRFRAEDIFPERIGLYEQLKPALMGDEAAAPYRELAEQLHTTL